MEAIMEKLSLRNLPMLTLILLLGISLLLAGCGTSSESAQAAAQEPTPEPLIPVEVAQVETGNIAQVFKYTGNLEGTQNHAWCQRSRGRGIG